MREEAYLLGDVVQGEGQVGLSESLNILLNHGLNSLLHKAEVTILEAAGQIQEEI